MAPPPSHALSTLVDAGFVPVFSRSDPADAVRVIDACRAAGVPAVEFTDRSGDAPAVFSELVRHYRREDPELLLGIGSILTADATERYLELGAGFVVSPILEREIMRACERRGALHIPGCATPSEIAAAQALGAEIVKVFPAETLGPAFLRAVRGPMPRVRLMPTGGVGTDENDLRGWFEAGAVCVGLGSSLVPPGPLDATAAAELEERCRRILGWIRAFRGRA